MDVRVDDRVALVTGASRGIGLACARAFLEAGAAGVVITSRREENLAAAAADLGDPDNLLTLAARADSEEDAERAVAATIERFGRCDILVNNAGTNPAFGNLAEVDMGAVDKTWAVNQRGPLLYTNAAVRQWMGEHGGAIVNIASVAGFQPSLGMGAYNVSKAALVHLTRQHAFELAPGIRVNGVAPAVVKTKLSAALWADEAAAASTHPLKRLGEPEDIANAVLFLASDKASWITGVTLPVDGGVVGAGGAVVT